MARLVMVAAMVAVGVTTLSVAVEAPLPAAAELTYGDVVVDDVGGHVFVTYGDTVRVFDLAGQQVATIADQPGAMDLLLRGRVLYVLAVGATRINTINADTFAVTGGFPLGSLVGLRSMAWTADRIWFTYGDQWTGGMGKLDPATGTVTAPLSTGLYAGGDIAATEAPARVYVLDRGLSPSKIRKFDVTTAQPTLLSTSPHSNACGNARELALAPDGGTAWTACGAPYKFNAFDTAILGEPATSYTSTNYPNAIERSADGDFLVGGTDSIYGIDVWFYEVGTYTALRSWEIGPSVTVVPGMVAVANGGKHVYAVSSDGVLHTWTLTPAITSVSPTHTTEGVATQVTVTGTALSDVTAATVGGLPASVAVLSDTSAKVTVPAALAAGTHALSVTSRWGTSPAAAGASVIVDPVKPDAPAAPTIAGTGMRSIDVAWTAPNDNGHPITGYTLKVFKGASATALEQREVAGTAATVTGLISEQQYRFSVVATSEAGSSAASPLSLYASAGNPDLGPHATLGAFVDAAYLDLEGRSPSAAERSAGVSALADGSVTPAEHLAAHRVSADALASVDPVARLYRATFLRIPDRSGLDHWVAKKRGGTRLTTIAASFAGSSEFKRRYGTLTNKAYVERLYLNVLGRAGDPSGVSYWTSKLDKKTRTRGEVLAGMSESNEYKRTQSAEVDAAVSYVALLRRAPTTPEFTAAVAALDGGGSTADLLESLLLSSEYAARY